MDHDACSRACEEANERHCPFEQAILSGQAGCRLAQRLCIGERDGLRCAHDVPQLRCLAFLDLARTQARFTLKAADREAALTHAQALRVQIGGLRGLAAMLAQDAPGADQIEDIDALLALADARCGDLAGLPWPLIVQEIAAFRGRRPTGRDG